MKCLTALFTTLLLLALPAHAQEKSWYASIGVSGFNESEEAGIQAGTGYAFALGRDLTKHIGIECELEFGPAADDFSYALLVDADLFRDMQSYEVDYAGIVYFSFMGTLTRPLNNTFNGVLKLGFSNFTNDAEVIIKTRDGKRHTEDVGHSYGQVAVASFGVELAPHQNWRTPMFFSVKSYFGDQHNSVAVSLGVRLKF